MGGGGGGEREREREREDKKKDIILKPRDNLSSLNHHPIPTHPTHSLTMDKLIVGPCTCTVY